MAIAIDFGTSNTVISRWNSATQQGETLKLPGFSQQLANNPPLIPSLLYWQDVREGKVLLGQQVRDRGLDLKNDPRYFRDFKRGIGSSIQGFLPELDDKIITFEQVGEQFLKTLIAELQKEQPIDSLVLTVPVDSFELYRHWLTGVCSQWNIEQIRILDEPTAAALGYGTTDEDVLLVVDFGGGTVDFSLVQLNLSGEGLDKKPMGFILKWGEKLLGESSGQKVKTARVLAKAGLNLGGSDIDHWLVDYFAQTQGIEKSSLITRLAERLKVKLSSQQKATEVYFNDETLESYELSLDQGTFREILTRQLFFNQLDDLMTQVLQRGRLQGIETRDIDGVLLVGGTTQIPAVQEWIQGYFERDKIKSEQPFEAIASGALQLAQGFQLKDFLYHSYGVRYWNRRNKCHSWHPIIKAGQGYPTNQPIELLLGASVENQPSIELIIGELGAQNSSTEVYFDGDRLITRTVSSGETAVQPLNDREGGRTIAQLSPLGNPGSDRIKVQFRVDEQCSLRITVEDLLTQETLLEDRPVVQLS
ncbi:Hsp70 family protein [Spirulina subsalsa]|uniref:Hsp70 family protein n=1 Tax=Spirulina subsalsa TaxID=54311 RepID=UPI0002F22D97|nr:Hsp70 family protein [Spirulina subsalsa]